MLLSQLKLKFLNLLKDEYPVQEVNSFFNFLIESYLGMNRLDFALKPGKELSLEEKEKFESAIHRLILHEPIQYIIGETEFFGLKFKVNKNVLIPRPETEELVQWILDDIRESKTPSNLKILDIGTGSGCIAISLAKNLPNAEIFTLDISENALKTARENAGLNKVNVNFMQADILNLEALSGKFDVIVSNPPYVREMEKAEMHRNVLENEPDLALYVKDTDPLIFYRKITKLAQAGLQENGNLYFEINQYLANETEEILKNPGFKTGLKKDIFGNYRMLRGRKKSNN
ncbi:MAG: peptide chain release factor N(5)-glutamine methyltransferase [Flavobacteriaceae bacterium]|nr:peptide chain release factor N(5)-glutamine methyltransferase [Flavobacteriaceae bacterium]